MVITFVYLDQFLGWIIKSQYLHLLTVFIFVTFFSLFLPLVEALYFIIFYFSYESTNMITHVEKVLIVHQNTSDQLSPEKRTSDIFVASVKKIFLGHVMSISVVILPTHVFRSYYQCFFENVVRDFSGMSQVK